MPEVNSLTTRGGGDNYEYSNIGLGVGAPAATCRHSLGGAEPPASGFIT